MLILNTINSNIITIMSYNEDNNLKDAFHIYNETQSKECMHKDFQFERVVQFHINADEQNIIHIY